MVYMTKFGSEKVSLKVEGLFVETGMPLIEMYGEDGSPYATLTVNLPEIPMPPGVVFIDHNFAEDKVRFVEENNLGECVGSIPHGFAVFPVVKLNVERLKNVISSGAAFLDEWVREEATA